MGSETLASGRIAAAIGQGTTAASDQSLSLGVCNDANGSDDGTLMAVGNGNLSSGSFKGNRPCDTNSDALVLDQSGNLMISGSLTEGSDRRLKTSIEPLGNGAIEALGEINPVRYRFKDQRARPSGQQIGLIAQDVRKEFPELVSTGSGGMLSLAYPKLTAVLLKGIQEQQSTIVQQQEQIEALKAESDTHEEKIANLEKRLVALEDGRSSALPAGLVGPWAAALLCGLLGLGTGLLWRRRF